MAPLGSDMNINKLVTGFSRAYSNDAFIADKILPPVKVQKEAGKYARYDKSNARISGVITLASDTQVAPRSTYGVDTDSYTTQLRRLADDVGQMTIANADSPFDPIRDATFNLQQQLGIDKEQAIVGDVLFASGNYASGNKVVLKNSTQWSNYGTATGAKGPIRKVASAGNTVLNTVLTTPNVLAFGNDVWVVLSRHPDLTDSIKHVSVLAKVQIQNALAALFGVDEVMMSRAVRNGAFPGETDSLSQVATDKAILIVRPSQQNTRSRAHSVQFQQSAFPNGDSWTEQSRMNATSIEVRDNYVAKVVDTGAGFMFDDVIA